MNDGNDIVLIGVGQLVQRDVRPEEARDPGGLMADAARLAADDSTLGARLLDKISLIATVDTFAWSPVSPAALLAEALGAKPARLVASTVGGNTTFSLRFESSATSQPSAAKARG